MKTKKRNNKKFTLQDGTLVELSREEKGYEIIVKKSRTMMWGSVYILDPKELMSLVREIVRDVREEANG